MLFFLITAWWLSGISGHAADVACATLWSKGFPIPGYSTNICSQASAVLGKHKVYYEKDSFTDSAAEQTLLNSIAASLETSEETYKNYGAMPPVVVVYLNAVSPEGSSIFATTFFRHNNSTEGCPIMAYSEMLKLNTDQQKQVLAHEVFHCFQARNLKELLMGPGGADFDLNYQITAWWVEGTADYFSNLAFPLVDYEHKNQISYQSDQPVYSQDDPYSVSAFFQSLGNYVMYGPNGIISFLKYDLPTGGGISDQREALAKDYRMPFAFHNFANELSRLSILDSGGHSTLPAGYKENFLSEKLPREDIVVPMNAEPFTVQTKLLTLPPDGLYKTRFSDSYAKDGGQVSFRKADPGNPRVPWNAMYENIAETFDTSCEDKDQQYEFLYTFVAKEAGLKEIQFHVEYEDNPCLCSETVPFDPCLFGKWRMDNASHDEMMRQLLDDTLYENSRGAIHLLINRNKTLEIVADNFTISYDVFYDTDYPVTVENIFSHKVSCKLGTVDPQTLCLVKPQGAIIVHTRIYLDADPVETEVTVPMQTGSLTHSCSGNTLIIKGFLPIGPGGGTVASDIVFHRQSTSSMQGLFQLLFE